MTGCTPVAWTRAVIAALVALGVERHRGDDADAQTQFNIGLDDIGVDGRQCNLRDQSLGRKCLVDPRAP